MYDPEMSLEEVEQCDECYLLYEYEDPVIHLFKRVKTYDEFISFERELKKGIKCCPHLWKDGYGKLWMAYKDVPPGYKLNAQRRRMKENEQ